MTREEAIDKLQNLWNEVYNEDSDGYTYAVAIDMAIEALKGGDAKMSPLQKPQTTPMKQSPSDGADLISRADAIKAVHKYFMDLFNDEPHETDEDGDEVFTDMKSVNTLLNHNKAVSKAIKALPSADRPSGEWTRETIIGLGVEHYNGYRCSECGSHCYPKSNYCPNCGADMRGDTE